MQYPLTSRIEKVASKDQSRPVLTACYLRDRGDGTGTLEATDSYKLARIPVTLDEGDVAGLVPVEALAAARNNRAGVLVCNGTVDVPGGPSFPRGEGQFPDSDRLMVDVEPGGFEIGLNAKLLYELAQALGSDGVKLSFVGGPGKLNALRPFTVHPIGGGIDGADGLIMPMKLSS